MTFQSVLQNGHHMPIDLTKWLLPANHLNKMAATCQSLSQNGRHMLKEKTIKKKIELISLHMLISSTKWLPHANQKKKKSCNS